MSNIRNQALEAEMDEHRRVYDANMHSAGAGDVHIYVPGKATADVYEPLLRNLVYLIPYASSTEAIILSDAYIRAKEALLDKVD